MWRAKDLKSNLHLKYYLQPAVQAFSAAGGTRGEKYPRAKSRWRESEEVVGGQMRRYSFSYENQDRAGLLTLPQSQQKALCMGCTAKVGRARPEHWTHGCPTSQVCLKSEPLQNSPQGFILSQLLQMHFVPSALVQWQILSTQRAVKCCLSSNSLMGNNHQDRGEQIITSCFVRISFFWALRMEWKEENNTLPTSPGTSGTLPGIQLPPSHSGFRWLAWQSLSSLLVSVDFNVWEENWPKPFVPYAVNRNISHCSPCSKSLCPLGTNFCFSFESPHGNKCIFPQVDCNAQPYTFATTVLVVVNRPVLG